MDEVSKLYINKCRTYVNFMLEEQQWSGLTRQEVERWLSNFSDLEPQKKLLVYKLLTGIIYFSENDVIEALKSGIYKCICYERILMRQISTDFQLSQHTLSNILYDEKKKTCFIPLLDSNSPHESGNYISRILVQNAIIPADRSMFIDKLPAEFQSGSITRMVIIDDCVGSGHQLSSFWNDTVVQDGTKTISLKALCQTYNIQANYLTLFGYAKSISELQSSLDGLKITCVRSLSDAQRVFSDNSYIWKDRDELNEAIQLFITLTKVNGIPLYGYFELDFAFIMHRTIPDWSLPLFWAEKPDWKFLMRRKNSNA